jgi:4-azaleucine resistance transporter AzlC
MLIGTGPMGLIFGALAAPSGLSGPGAVLMSALVYAGSAQLIALTLLAGGAGVAVIVATTLVVNLRHVLYAATLQPHVAALPQRWRAPLAFWLTDATFALTLRRYAAADPSTSTHWYYLGSCVAVYGNWLVWTVVGVVLGGAVAGLAGLGLEFAVVATFTAIIAPLLRTRSMMAAALCAAGVALLAHGLPYKLGLLLAALAGVTAGVWVQSGERADDPA